MEICYVNITKHNYEKSTSYILRSVTRNIKITSEYASDENSSMHAFCGKHFLGNLLASRFMLVANDIKRRKFSPRTIGKVFFSRLKSCWKQH